MIKSAGHPCLTLLSQGSGEAASQGGKVGGVWSFSPCEGGTQGGSSSASALHRFGIQAIENRSNFFLDKSHC